MRSIDVRPQQKLPLSKTFGLCVNGVKHRILRSALTLAVVALAVAFFMFLQTETRLLQSVGRSAHTELEDLRFATRRLNRLTQNRRLSDQAKILAGFSVQTDEAVWRELSGVTGWPVPRIQTLARAAAAEKKYLTFFEELPLGQRVILVGKRKGRSIFHFLEPEESREAFSQNIEPMHDVQIPDGMERFREMLDGFPAYYETLKTFNAEWNSTVSALRDELNALEPARDLSEWLSTANAGQQAQVLRKINEKGFRLQKDELLRIQDQLRTQQLLKAVSAELSRAAKMEQWKKTFLERTPPALEQKLARLDEPKVRDLLADSFTEEELLAVHQYFIRNRELEKTLQALAGRIDLNLKSGIAGRQMFLLFISLMVCMVGITNAMLMSISERFREIATMKCLGATDEFILRQFMLEAAIQGAAGGLIGMVAGLIIALLKTFASFGMDTFGSLPLTGILLSALISFFCGVGLSILASIYPSWAASRMAPMEAMRIE